MRQLSHRQIGVVKTLLFILLALPSIYAAARVAMGHVAEPADYLTHITGEFALRLLVLTLLVTPLITVSGWNWLIHLRRMIGLYAFYYALLHFMVYLLLDLQLELALVLEDIAERRYITVGFVALLLLLPLAITSNNYLLRKMGARRWAKLHKLVYLIAPLGIIHFWWQVKSGAFASPLGYALIIALLLLLRHPAVVKKIKRR